MCSKALADIVIPQVKDRFFFISWVKYSVIPQTKDYVCFQRENIFYDSIGKV